MISVPIIHVIDDDPAMLDSLRLLLQVEGYSVSAYGSAHAFLDGICSDHFGCVLTDMHMPEISGLDLLAIMKEQRVSMPVIVITAHADNQLASAAKELGAYDFFAKPFDHDTLLASIREALEGAWTGGGGVTT